jgi:hypothetical protein
VTLLLYNIKAKYKNFKPCFKSKQVKQRIKVKEGLVNKDKEVLNKANICESRFIKGIKQV